MTRAASATPARRIPTGLRMLSIALVYNPPLMCHTLHRVAPKRSARVFETHHLDHLRNNACSLAILNGEGLRPESLSGVRQVL